MKKVRLYESFHGIDEARHSEIHKAAKQGSYPVTIVITNKGGSFDGKVAHQETVDTPAAVPAAMKVLYKKYATWGHTFAIEDATGKILFQEGLEVDEAYDGNMADFKYEFPQVFVDVTGNPEKAIKKIKKAGKGFEVRTSAYMSEEEMEEVASALGMVLVDYEKNSNMAISVFEGVVNESEWVAYISYPRGKKLVKTLKSHRAAVMWNNKNVDSILMQDGVEGVGIMSKEMWDDNEAEWAIESVVTEGRSINKIKKEYDKVIADMADKVKSWKDCKESGDAKGEAACLADLKDLTAKKKALMVELDDAVGLKDVDAELAESVNESIKFGSYYFPKTAQDIEKILPEGGWKIGETKYAVICHNTVQMGKNIMYLKSDNSKIGQNFEAHILSIHNTEEEAFEAYKNAVKYDEGMTASCVSYAYGTLKSKGANYPFDEIGGERKTIK